MKKYEQTNAGRTCQDNPTAMESPPNIPSAISSQRGFINPKQIKICMEIQGVGIFTEIL
jgi:hypothetical protein